MKLYRHSKLRQWSGLAKVGMGVCSKEGIELVTRPSGKNGEGKVEEGVHLTDATIGY